jgi:hypothetical protein
VAPSTNLTTALLNSEEIKLKGIMPIIAIDLPINFTE